MEKLVTVLCCLVTFIPSGVRPQLPSYEDDLSGYGDAAAASAPQMSGIDMLRMSVPGNPGQDYPIYAEIPETSFTCDGRVEGGYYADVEAECQPFHVCTTDSASGALLPISFLCPNGTLFNQEHFVCEYWFNVDCSAAESFYNLNDNIGDVPDNSLSADASSPVSGYAPPSSASSSPSSYESPSVAASSPVGYSAPSDTSYSSPSSSPPDESYGAALPDYSTAGRTGRNRQGKSRPVIKKKKATSRPSNNRGLTNNRNGNQTPRRGRTNDNNNSGRRVPSTRPSQNQPTRSNIFGQNPPARSNNANVGQTRSNNFAQNQPTRSNNVAQKQQSRSNTVAQKQPTRSNNVAQNQPSRSNTVTQNQPSRSNNVANNQPTRSNTATKNQPSRSNNVAKNQPSRSAGQNQFNEVDVNVRRPKPNRNRQTSAKKFNKFSRDQVKGSSRLVPPGPAGPVQSVKSTKTRGKKFGQNKDRRQGRQQDLGTGYLPPVEDNSLASYDDYEYEEAPLPTYNSASGVADAVDLKTAPVDSGYSSPDDSYAAPANGYNSPDINYDEVAADLADEVYEEDELPTYNNGVYSDGNAKSVNTYSAPEPAYDEPEEEYEDELPTYNNGVYSEGNAQSVNTYSAPIADSIPADDALNEEDVLPQYNNGVYNNGNTGDNYIAPASDAAPAVTSYLEPSADDSYSSPNTFASAPSSSSSSYSSPFSPSSPSAAPSSYGSPSSSSFTPISSPSSSSYNSPSSSSSYNAPSSSANTFETAVPGSYQDPTADILPEYHKSEISLGLNNRNEVPRIEPFSNDFGEPLYIGTYKASGSAVRPAVIQPPAPTPDTSYGVPSAIPLSDYKLPEISDIGYTGTGGSSYGK